MSIYRQKGGNLKSNGQPCMKLGQTSSLTAQSFITIKLSGIKQKSIRLSAPCIVMHHSV